ncbi:MAG TPA: hypothetical protein ENI23_02580 [bacterium]|nr:hypothetical protein [bacterium]
MSADKAQDKGYEYTKKEKGDLGLDLEIKVSGKRFQREKDKVFAGLAKDIEISGFRKGKAPKNLVEAKLGANLFEETLNHLLPEVTVEIIQKEELLPITRVEYKVQEVSDSGVKFTASFTLYPEIKLGDFSKIKVKEESISVDDKEVDEVVKKMFEDYRKAQEAKDSSSSKNEKGPDSRAVSLEGPREKNRSRIKSGNKGKETQSSPLTAHSSLKMDDEWAKKAGLGVNDMKGLKEKIKKQLDEYKQKMNKDKYVNDIITEAIKLSKFEVPSALIDQELDRREADYKNRIENLGLKIDDYLKTQKVTMKELRKQWEEDARKKVQIEMLLVEIAKEENLNVGDEEIDKEIELIQEKKLKDFYSSDRGRSYIRSVVSQQKAVKHLLDIVEKKADS